MNPAPFQPLTVDEQIEILFASANHYRHCIVRTRNARQLRELQLRLAQIKRDCERIIRNQS